MNSVCYMIVLSFPLWGHTVNTHLRDNNTEMLEDRPSELGGSCYYLYEDTEAREVVYKRSLLRVVLFYYFILPWPSEICSLCCLLRHRYRLMCLKKLLPRIEINSIFCFNCLLLVIRVEGVTSLDIGKMLRCIERTED